MRNISFGKLSIKNFKVHREIDFDFSSNKLVLIAGNNGKGKTTIFDAIMWALYDEDTKGVTGDSIVHKRVGKDTEVVIEWKDDDDEYVVHSYRKSKKFKNDRYLFKNGNDITCATKKETLDRISELLLPKDVFRNCLLFSQYVKNNFAESTHSFQRDILDNLMLLNIYDELYKKIDSSISEEKSEIDKINANIPKSIGIIETTEKIIVDAKESIQREELENENKKKEIQEKIDEFKEKENESDISEEEINNLKEHKTQKIQEKTKLESNIENIKEKANSEFKEWKSIIELEENKKISAIREHINTDKNELSLELENLNKKLSDAKDKTWNATKELEDKKTSKIEELDSKSKDKINDLKEKKSNIDSNLFGMDSDIENRLNNATKLEYEINELVEKINQPEKRCYACNSILDSDALNSLKNRLKELEDTKKNHECVANDLKKERINLEKEREKLNNSINELEQTSIEEKNSVRKHYTIKIEEINEKLERYDKDINIKISGIKSKIEDLKTNLNEQEANIKEEYNSKRESKLVEIRNKYKDDAEKLKNKLSELEKELNDINNEILLKESKFQELRDLKQNIITLSKEIKSSQESFEGRKIKSLKYIEELKNDIKEKQNFVDKHNTSIKEMERKIDILSFWKKAFSDTGIKSVIMDEAVPILNERANELSNMTEDIIVKFDSQTQLKSGDLKNKFSITALNTTNLSEFSEFSAGEKRLVNIIVLLSLRYLLERMQNTRINIVLMDEILDSLDPNNSGIVVDILKKLSFDHCVILISHTFREFIDADEKIIL